MHSEWILETLNNKTLPKVSVKGLDQNVLNMLDLSEI